MAVALVTGAGSLLGVGVCKVLTGLGWTVVATGIRVGEEPYLTELKPFCDSTLELDVTDLDAAKDVADEITRRYGRIDALVNGAGGALGLKRKPFHETPPDEWTAVLDVNLTGVLNCCHAVLPTMLANRSGSIVTIASGRGLRGARDVAAYSAAKGGVITFSQSLAQELGAHGIRVNTVAPGNAEARWKKPGEGSQSPLGRLTSGDDVGHAVAFLLSEGASHITGSCLDISGGIALH